MRQKTSGAEMPFLDHLEELRWRILWSLAALLLGMIVAFVLVTRVDVIGFLQAPILPHLGGKKLVYTHPAEPFSIVMKVSFGVGLIVALPVIIYQVWAFLSPALYRHEKRVVMPVIAGAVLLFAGGVMLAYRYILPLTLGFLITFETRALEPMITAGQYFGFAITMSLAFGAVFELPIVILALTALGIVTPRMLRRFRRYAVILSMVAGALITPGGDLLSLALLTGPIYLLYEASILIAHVVHRRRELRIAADRAEREAPA
ncbi:MAG: twin-arginine translocase subunit TatC [Gemmatimonadaceae bacterium]